MRIALLSYRGNPHSGGQGVYVRYLSRALVDLGHDVTVISGPPYPQLDPVVGLVRVPSLDLYRADDPFRRPRRDEFKDWIDVLEYAAMCTAAFPEPLTFSLRAARLLRSGDRFDIVHDNQGLGYGLLAIAPRVPVVATIHHPCSLDRDLELRDPQQRNAWATRRWYSFTRMQARVARRLQRIICVSEAGCGDVLKEFRVRRERTSIVHNGVDNQLFRPLPDVRRVPGRLVTTASADVPLKGLVHLLEAVAKLRTERDVSLVVVGRAKPNGAVAQAIERFCLRDAVRFESAIGSLRLVELYAECELAVVPSLYEAFSLPAAEAMACGVAVVATRTGGLPEVVGRDGESAMLVPPGDPGALAAAIGRLLDERELRARIAAAGQQRALARFTWTAAAQRTVDVYREAIGRC